MEPDRPTIQRDAGAEETGYSHLARVSNRILVPPVRQFFIFSPVKIVCSCGQEYWPNQSWIHAGCATNTPATNVVATNNSATNFITVEQFRDEFPSPKTANRRDREKYNAYQREYMRKRRGSRPSY